MNQPLIIFDFDGVIVNTFSFCYEINKDQFGITEEEYRKRFEGNFYKSYSNIKPKDNNFDFFSLYTPKLLETKPVAGIEKEIQHLSKDHVLCIVSSTLTQPIKDYLEKNHLNEYFNDIQGSDQSKDKIEKIQNLLEKHNKKPNEAIFITDTLGDIGVAQECEVSSIAVTWGYHPEATLKKGNPYAMISDPSRLCELIKNYVH